MFLLRFVFIVLFLFGSVFGQNITKTSSSELVGYKRFSATAYCLKANKTATGHTVRYGIIAVDPRVIKLGSYVNIAGLGNFIALDTGGAIKGNRIDIWMGSCSAAKKFGRRAVFLKKN